MSERGSFRGRGSGRGGGAGRGGGKAGAQAEKPKKENILDLTKYMDKQINVKFNGGREGGLKDHRLPNSYANLSSHWHAQRLRSTHESRFRRHERAYKR